MSGEDLVLRINHRDLTAAVRCAVSEELDSSGMKRTVELAVQEQLARVEKHADKLIQDMCKESIDRIRRRASDLFSQFEETEFRRAVKSVVMNKVEEQVDLAVQQIVEDGVSVRIGSKRVGIPTTLETVVATEDSNGTD